MHCHLSEWYRADQEETGYLLHEGCCATTETDGEVDVYHQLHGDGQGHRCTTELPANQRSTDKGCIPATEEGNAMLYCYWFT